MAKKNTKTAKAATKKVGSLNIATPPVEEQEQIIDTTQATVEPEPTGPAKPRINPSIATVTIGDLATGNATNGLDANHRVELLGLVNDMFIKNDSTARNKFGDQVVDAMSDIAYIGVITAVADEVVNGNSSFALTIKSKAYAQLASAASAIGVTLPPITKALPGSDEGTVRVTSDIIKVSKETKKQLKEEKEIESAGDQEQIELDPVKVAHMSEDDLRKALNYLLITGPKRNRSVKTTLTTMVDFMHDYRIELARQADNSTEAMTQYEDRTIYDWFQDIFQYVIPTTYINGIGLGMHYLVAQEKSPLSAFIALRGQMYKKDNGVAVKDENGNYVMEWDDQSIADAVRATVEFKCNTNIKSTEEKIAALDKKAKDYKDRLKTFNGVLADEHAIMDSLTSFSFDIADKYTESAENNVYQKAYGRILKMYYPECEHRGGNYRNLNENIQQRVGIILNLFKSPDTKNQAYSESNLLPVEEIPMEEVAKAEIEAKKTDEAKAETKKK